MSEEIRPGDAPLNPGRIGGAYLGYRVDRMGYELLFWTERITGCGQFVCKGLEWEWVPFRSFATPEPLTVDREAAQELLDALWNAGLRPSERHCPDVAHLTDMREIVRGLLNSLAGVEVNLP